jgi:hypothetical protein
MPVLEYTVNQVSLSDSSHYTVLGLSTARHKIRRLLGQGHASTRKRFVPIVPTLCFKPMISQIESVKSRLFNRRSITDNSVHDVEVQLWILLHQLLPFRCFADFLPYGSDVFHGFFEEPSEFLSRIRKSSIAPLDLSPT